jgi:hypothetical protein
MATTAGHFGIETPRSDAQTMDSINADDLSFGSQEGSFVSPSKLKQKQQAPITGPQQFLSRLTQPTGSTPLGEIKNNARPSRALGAKAQEFTPLLKSVKKAEFLRRGLPTQTPSKLRHGTSGFAKSASTSNLPEMVEMESQEYSAIAEEASTTQNEKDLVDMSSATASFQKLPTRSPGSNDGAAMLTLREQEKVCLYKWLANYRSLMKSGKRISRSN